MKITRGIHLVDASQWMNYEIDIPIHVYLLLTKEGVVLIDSGTAASPQSSIYPYLKKLGMSPKDVFLLINTHGHLDHIGGNFEIKDKSRAKIAAHKLDVPWIINHDLQFKEAQSRPEIMPPPKEDRDFFYKIVGKETVVDIALQDGHTWDFEPDFKLRLIHTPGHSKGSISIYEEERKILFTGDSVQHKGSQVTITPCYIDVNAYLASLERLRSLEIDYLLPSHFSILKGSDTQKFILESIEYVTIMEKKVKNAILAPNTVRSVTESVCRMLGSTKITPQAIFTVEAHLRKLAKTLDI